MLAEASEVAATTLFRSLVQWVVQCHERDTVNFRTRLVLRVFLEILFSVSILTYLFLRLTLAPSHGPLSVKGDYGLSEREWNYSSISKFSGLSRWESALDLGVQSMDHPFRCCPLSMFSFQIQEGSFTHHTCHV